MRFRFYCQKAIENYQNRLQGIREEINRAKIKGDTAVLKAAERRLAEQKWKLTGIFAFLFCCLFLIIFGI